jgi:hypothetical protein
MALESLHGTFCIVTSIVWWVEFNGAAIAKYSGFEFLWCLVVKDVPIDVVYLGVFQHWWMDWYALMRSLVLCDFMHSASM